MTAQILVVDDEPDLELLITQRFRRQIRDGGYRFTFAGDGVQALQALEADPSIDMVVTDINMPRMDGLTLLAKLQERETDLATIIVSAYGDMSNIRTAMNRGAFDFLIKPIDFADLEATIAKTLRGLEIIRGYQRRHLEAEWTRARLALIEEELQLARDIQMGMLRRLGAAHEDRRDFRIAAMLEPARQVGGDFYDAFLIDPNRLVLAIGDVAGKGISAALFMVRALTLLRSPATAWVSLEQTLADANNELARDNDRCMFLTLFMAVLDLRTGRADYVNFGHPPPVVRSSDGTVMFHEVRSGMVFGVVVEAAGAAGHMTLPFGGTLLLYSDGVTESENQQQTLLGGETLRMAVAAAATNEPASLIGTVIDAVRRHAGGAEQSDDITLMAVTWLGRD